MPNRPYNTKPRSFLGYGYQRTTTGDFISLGRNRNRNNSTLSGSADYTGGDSWGSGNGNESTGFTSYDTEASYFGENQDEWEDNMYDGPTSEEGEGGKNKGGKSNFKAGGMINLGLQAADAFIPGASKNPYLQSAKKNPLLKAGMQTGNLGLLAAGVVSTVIMGGKEKKKMATDKKINNNLVGNTNKRNEGSQSKNISAMNFQANQSSAASNAYGVGDIDNFTNKYS
jgi:hypothetical protein